MDQTNDRRRLVIAAIAGFIFALTILRLLVVFIRPVTIVSAYVAPKTAKSGVKPITVTNSGEMKTAIVTAYSCGGLKTDKQIKMNCPSLKKYPKGRTSSGTIPRPYITVACDRANKGRTFYLDGIGNVVCEDTGGAIRGPGRFDLYVSDVSEAIKFGRQEIKYRLVK